MSLAVAREPRNTAGNRMSKLLDAEEEDDFYKTTYGGFNDVSIQTSRAGTCTDVLQLGCIALLCRCKAVYIKRHN